MREKLKKFARSLLDLEAKSHGAVPPSPLVLSEFFMKGVRKVLALTPPAHDRLTGKLAKDGGKRIRDKNLRPYAPSPAHSVGEWFFKVGPVMGKIFRTGAEGAPQKLSKEFAQKWATYCGVQHGLLLPHGTDALKVALAAALNHDGMDYGGEVIVPNLGFIASVNSALDKRIGVALVDVDPSTLNIDPKRVEEAIIPGKTRAIMPVHLFGQPADMTALREIAKRHNLVIIEDAAQAHGAIHELGRAGSLGDAAAFSFQSSKNLSAGEGGAVTTNNRDLYIRADCMHNVGRAHTGAQRWSHETLGWNLRPSEYIAAALLHRLDALEAEQETRHKRFNLLRESLADVTCVEPLGIGPGVVRHGVYMFVLRYKPENCAGLVMEDFMAAVGAEGIPIYPAYTETLSQQPALQTVAEKHPEYIRVLPTPVADQAVKEIMYLAHQIFLGPEKDMIEIAAAFRKVQAHFAPEKLGARSGKAEAGFAKAAPVPATAPVTKTVRFGIIGFGGMGREHASVLSKLEGAKLVGVTDQQSSAQAAAAEFNCAWYDSAVKLISSGDVDAVVIATPHWLHPELSIAALKAGVHVICEKPLTVTIGQSDAVLEAAAKSDRLFAVVHQNRFHPAYRKVKEIMESGELGPLHRAVIVESYWRTAAYFKSSPWRGTWKGEGGGVLLNQAPHVLDRYAWLCGMPASLMAFCDTTLHTIEVEDTASAVLRHANGAHGHLHISTTEEPHVSRVSISCDQGRIIVENDRVTVTKLEKSISDRTVNDPNLWASIGGRTREYLLSQSDSMAKLLTAFYENFIAAIEGREPLATPAQEGRNTVELANAMVLSSALGREIKLPLDRKQYSDFIEARLAAATPRNPAGAIP
ncbi:MAG TPA: DegT/DnrJ/EryC1/StrS family aminotransferase [Chthoniobacteraceae bacterium]|nr:DegT/DnrJ/EryC1/StrS family aminotransferase [Chthoniobacteraceae bacterium]